eukprot:COSAG02_NODE_38346_length_430_cov_0.833837_1_plen_33_part_01
MCGWPAPSVLRAAWPVLLTGARGAGGGARAAEG